MEFILSDGTREYDFLSEPRGVAYVQAEGLNLPVVSREDTFAESADSEGRTRVRSRALNPEGWGFSVFFDAAGDNIAFWEAIDDLQELVESAHRNKGTLTADTGGGAVTFYLETVNVTDLPQKGVHLRQQHGEATVTFESKPYGRLVSVEDLASGTMDAPIDFLTVEDVPGQVDAWGNLRVEDPDSQARNHVEIGVQHDFDPDNPEPILLEAVTDLAGLAGASNTRSGSYSTNVLRVALTTSPVAVCTSGKQPHEGTWKFRSRVWPSATTIRVRLAYRSGEGPFTTGKWASVPGEDDWFDLDLGTYSIGELPSGHTAEFRVEGITTSGVPLLDVDLLMPIPADNYTRLRGSSSSDTPSGPIVAVENFDSQTSGALAGKTPLLAPSGDWSGTGDAGDFSVNVSEGDVRRSEVSDSSLNNGRYARCGTGVLATTIARVDMIFPYTIFGHWGRFGVLLRYTDTNNWLMGVYLNANTVALLKRVAGTVTTLGTSTPYGGNTSGYRTLIVSAHTDGSSALYEGPRDGVQSQRIYISGDSSLATSGALDDGGYGIYDANVQTYGGTRRYDNFSVSTSAVSSTILNPAINSGQGLDLFHDTALTDNAAGDGQGTTPIREGKYLTLPPATRNGLKSRIVVKARRNDIDGALPDIGLDDTLTASLAVTPRVHLTGR